MPCGSCVCQNSHILHSPQSVFVETPRNTCPFPRNPLIKAAGYPPEALQNKLSPGEKRDDALSGWGKGVTVTLP